MDENTLDVANEHFLEGFYQHIIRFTAHYRMLQDIPGQGLNRTAMFVSQQ